MTNEEILNEIKSTMLDLHPYMENRLSILLKYPNPSMDITFYFHNHGTTIMFADGLESKKNSISKKIELPFIVKPDLIINLISLILQDHDYISNLVKSNDTLVIGTDVELSLENINGISCGTINIELNLHNYPNNEELLNNYYDAIVCTFYDQVKGIPSFKCQLESVKNLTKKEMLNILSNLNEEELHKLISNLSVPVFMKAYQGNKLIRNNQNKKLT